MATKETVKGLFGNENIELNNAATETTLTALLKIAQKDSATLAEMAKKAGIDSKKIQDSLDKNHQTGSGGGGGGAGAVLGGAAKIAGGLISDLGSMAMSAAGGLVNFGEALMTGTVKASDLAKAFSGLPLGIGLFASAMAYASKYFEDNMAAFRAMANTGAGVIGGLGELKINATALGLTLEQYSSMFGKNADVMVRLGGSMAQGSKNLVAMNQSFIGSNMGQRILQLGYSYEELNNMIPNYIRSTGDSIDSSKNFKDEMVRLQTISSKYAEDLDYVARATGENREELQRKKQEIIQEASFQLWYLKQPRAQQKAIDEVINRNLAIGGKPYVDATKAALQGFAGAATKEGAAVNSYFAEANEVIAEQVKLTKSNLPDAERKAILDRLQVKSIQGFVKNIDDIEGVVYSLGAQGKLQSTGITEIIEKTNRYRTEEGGKLKSTKKMLDDLAIVTEGQKNDAGKTTKELEKEAEVREESIKLQKALKPIMEDLNLLTLKLMRDFGKMITDNMPLIQKSLDDVRAFIHKVFNNPDAAIAQVKGYLQELMAWFFEGLATGPIGKFLFGDAAESMKQRSQLNAALAIDAQRYAELKKQNAEGTLKGRDAEEFARANEIYRNAAGVIAYQMRTKEYDKDAAIAEANRRLKAAGKDPNANSGVFDPGGTMQYTNYQLELKRIYDKFNADKALRDAEAAKIQSGGYTYEGIPALIKKLDQNLYNPNAIPGRAGGSPGGKAEDWGRESLVKLHGKEAVLTEDQLSAMNRSGIGNTTIELADLKIVAEGIITLNRQAAMQNKILNQMIDNQKTMIQRSSGNRLMA